MKHSEKIKIKNKKNKTRKLKVYTKKDYNSGDGMLTSVWGPSLWHYLHTMSFNYPTEPTQEQKTHYKNFILSLQNVLPCKYCRMNLKNNLKVLPLTQSRLKNRESFSLYIYELHELINKMLGKKSGLSYADVRERYEHFRSRCSLDIDLDTLSNKSGSKNREKLGGVSLKHQNVISKTNQSKSSNKKTRKHKEKGCVTPLYGKKSKCIIKIVPQDEKCETFQMDKKCMKVKLT